MTGINQQQLRNYFINDRYVKTSEIAIAEITPDYAICEVIVKDFHLNAAHLAQGGLIYTLADFTFAVMANNLHPVTVTQSASITYLAPAKLGSTLYAKAREIARVNRNCTYEVIVTDDSGKTIAIMQANGFINEKAELR